MTAPAILGMDLVETPEGRAIYPFGARGAGYLLDEASEARLRLVQRRLLWGIVPAIALDAALRWGLHVPDFAAFVIAWTAFFGLACAAVMSILRERPRASARPSSDELLRLRIARVGREPVVLAHVFGLILAVAVVVALLLVGEGLERWIALAVCAGFALLVIVGLLRIRRIPE